MRIPLVAYILANAMGVRHDNHDLMYILSESPNLSVENRSRESAKNEVVKV